MIAALALTALLATPTEPVEVVVGSKNFTEGVILGELAAQLAADAGASVQHRRALGGTRIVFNALVAGEVDVYAEYTGTLIHEIFADETIANEAQLRERLAAQGVTMSATLGFVDNYALGMRKMRAGELGIETISDLRRHPELTFRFGNEFVERADGWPGLRSLYDLPQTDVRGIEHDLAYRGLAEGDADVTDLYTTDAEIAYYDLAVLEDDRRYFPEYHAVLLYRAELSESAPEVVSGLVRLTGRIDEAAMIAMNAEAKLDGLDEAVVASSFLKRELDVTSNVAPAGRTERLLRTTIEHLLLVVSSLLVAILLAIPLGVAAARRPGFGQLVLGSVGIAQTIPALALLVFMIPLFGLGAGPAVVALFVYSLLPIVRNTHAGLVGIPAALRESAEAIGLPASARLRRVELPLALPSILAGIKTAAVINVGAATLGALIGAGGYGQPILTGIRRDDLGLILEGALPAALLALTMQGAFDVLERALVSKGLRDARAEGA